MNHSHQHSVLLWPVDADGDRYLLTLFIRQCCEFRSAVRTSYLKPGPIFAFFDSYLQAAAHGPCRGNVRVSVEERSWHGADNPHSRLTLHSWAVGGRSRAMIVCVCVYLWVPAVCLPQILHKELVLGGEITRPAATGRTSQFSLSPFSLSLAVSFLLGLCRWLMSCRAILCNELPAYMPSVLPCLVGMKYCRGKCEGNREGYGVDGRLVE